MGSAGERGIKTGQTATLSSSGDWNCGALQLQFGYSITEITVSMDGQTLEGFYT